MHPLSPTNFGLLIAYIIPGSGLLFCLRRINETIETWFGTIGQQAPTVAGFLYVTLAAIAMGLLLSTIRWLLLDSLHHATGIEQPNLAWERLAEVRDAFQLVVEHKYRYYQFYGNSLVGLLLTIPFELSSGDNVTAVSSIIYVIIAGLLFLGSRDTLRGYYLESLRLLGVLPSSSPAASRSSDTEIP